MFHLPRPILRLLPDRKRVTDPATSADQRIAGRLQDLFEKELALSDLDDLQFFVHRRSVLLRGSFMDEDERDSVRSLISAVPEVKNVIDHRDQPLARAA